MENNQINKEIKRRTPELPSELASNCSPELTDEDEYYYIKTKFTQFLKWAVLGGDKYPEL